MDTPEVEKEKQGQAEPFNNRTTSRWNREASGGARGPELNAETSKSTLQREPYRAERSPARFPRPETDQLSQFGKT
ncbi:MAG: hypothetical protein CMN75_01915, partial [Spirochaeta sp.]|nr:hypothetical protein [Spirochaeta sp.]